MTTMKSLEKRLARIPEPDLDYYQSEERCRFFMQFPFERWLATRELFRDAEKAGRIPSWEEFAAALGISTPEADTTSRSDDNEACANPETTGDAKAPPTKPNRRRSRDDKGDPSVIGGE